MNDHKKLIEHAKKIRRDTLELSIANGGYHFGGSFSCVEILISLYDSVMYSDDTFILSKGHSCWPWYAILRERGLNPKLEGHPSRDPLNGITCTAGSEGHGLPMGIGIALANKNHLKKTGHVYVLVGDGECQEGTTWESLLTASHHRLSNLTVIVDNNKIQGSGFVNDILPITSLKDCAIAMNWNVMEIQGHNFCDLLTAFSHWRYNIKPNLIIANTIKGKGVSYMEGKPEWHAKFPNKDQLEIARNELS